MLFKTQNTKLSIHYDRGKVKKKKLIMQAYSQVVKNSIRYSIKQIFWRITKTLHSNKIISRWQGMCLFSSAKFSFGCCNNSLHQTWVLPPGGYTFTLSKKTDFNEGLKESGEHHQRCLVDTSRVCIRWRLFRLHCSLPVQEMRLVDWMCAAAVVKLNEGP